MKKTTKLIAMSVLTIVACVSLISGATFALFTSESSVNIAVTSGKVDVDASVSALWTYSNATDDIAIDAIDGWKPADAPSDGEFAGEWDNLGTVTYAAADGLGKLSLNNITPGDAVKFTFSVTNNSNVAVRYQVRITVGAEKSTDVNDEYPDAKLSEALEINFNGKTVVGVTQQATAWSDVTEPSADVLATQDIAIRLPKNSGDEYQTKSCEINLVVVAIQGNADETSYCEMHGEHVYDPATNKCIYCGEENPIKGSLDPSTGNYVIESMPIEPGTTELTVPGTVGGAPVSIKDGAFQNNHDLESVTFEEGVVSIGASAFEYCDNITEVNLPESLESIGANAFKRCESLTEVNLPESLTSIEESAFELCIQLKEITIPDSVEQIGQNAFLDCFELQSVTLGTGITEIGDSVFYNCSALTNVNINGAVTKIGWSAFSGCHQLTTIELPATLETIDSSAFQGCSSLSTIDLSKCTNLTTIDSNAFNRSGLTEITIPDNVTYLGSSAFGSCDRLQTVTLGVGITSIPTSLLVNCSSLTTLTINGKLSRISGNVFSGCSQLAEIHYNGGSSEDWKALANGPYSTTFSGCSADIKITCNDGITLDKNGEVQP